MILLVQVMKKMTDMIDEKRECQGDLNLPPREETENLRKVNIDSTIFLTGPEVCVGFPYFLHKS